jgi:hypothetical protein
LVSHRRAHELFHGAFAEAAVHNAYEAARAAAVAGLEGEAVDWLRQAVEADPGLAEEAQAEADFVNLRQNADFQSLHGPNRGLLSA